MAYLYKIVLFEDDKTETFSVDIVPTNWIFGSEELNSKACRFPVGPFKQSQISNLHKKIKKCQPADNSWPIHRIKIHGRARTYKEACAAVEKLEYNRYAFSTDRESSVERIVIEENYIDKFEKVQHKSITDELNDARVELNNDLSIDYSKKDLQKSRINITSHSPSYSSDYSESEEEDKEFSESDSVASSLHEAPDGKKMRSKSHSFQTRNFDLIGPKKTIISESPLNECDSEMFKENRPNKSREKISEKLSKFPSSTAFTEEGTILIEKQNSVCQFESPSQSKKRLRPSPDSSLSELDTDKTYTGTPKISRRSPLKEKKSKKARPILFSPTFITGSKDQNTSFTSQLNISSSESSQRKRPEENFRRSRSAEASSNDKIVTLASLNRSRSETPKHKRPEINSRFLRSEDAGAKGDEIVTIASLAALIKTVHHSLSSKIDRLHGTQVEINGKIDKLIDISRQKCQIESEDEIEENNQILLPVDTKEVFNIFDVRLKDDKEYRCKIKNRIKNMIPRNKTYETRSLSIILRTFLTKDLVRSSFTALQKTTDKVPLKETNFYKCLLDVHLQILGDAMDEEKFKGALKGSLNAAKDWEGGRALRRG